MMGVEGLSPAEEVWSHKGYTRKCVGAEIVLYLGSITPKQSCTTWRLQKYCLFEKHLSFFLRVVEIANSTIDLMRVKCLSAFGAQPPSAYGNLNSNVREMGRMQDARFVTVVAFTVTTSRRVSVNLGDKSWCIYCPSLLWIWTLNNCCSSVRSARAEAFR